MTASQSAPRARLPVTATRTDHRLGGLVRPVAVAGLRLLAAAGLAVDGYVHAHDAGFYDRVRTATLSQGLLFRVEAGLAAAAALLVLVGWRSRRSWLPALVVGAGGVAAVLLYRYVDVGSLGPVPNMYEPTWAVPFKLLSAYAEGGTAVLAALGFALAGRPRGSLADIR